jgi:hypothetical protein
VGKTCRETLGVPIPHNVHTNTRTTVQDNAAASNDARRSSDPSPAVIPRDAWDLSCGLKGPSLRSG